MYYFPIIITGGEDINPLLYNDSSNLKVCGDIDHRRDTLEKKLFDYAFENKIPLIGVCRGMQMINVASEDDGLNNGEAMRFKLWNKRFNTTQELIVKEWIEGANAYQTDACCLC